MSYWFDWDREILSHDCPLNKDASLHFFRWFGSISMRTSGPRYPPQLSKDLNLEVRGEDFPRKKHFLQTKVSPVTVKPPTFCLVAIFKVESKELELELEQPKENRYPCIYQRTWKTRKEKIQ